MASEIKPEQTDLSLLFSMPVIVIQWREEMMILPYRMERYLGVRMIYLGKVSPMICIGTDLKTIRAVFKLIQTLMLFILVLVKHILGIKR